MRCKICQKKLIRLFFVIRFELLLFGKVNNSEINCLKISEDKKEEELLGYFPRIFFIFSVTKFKI